MVTIEEAGKCPYKLPCGAVPCDLYGECPHKEESSTANRPFVWTLNSCWNSTGNYYE